MQVSIVLTRNLDRAAACRWLSRCLLLVIASMGLRLLEAEAAMAADGVVAEVTANSVDYATLADPRVANRLELTDPQRADVVKLLDGMAQQLAASPRDQWPAVRAKTQQDLAAVLTDAQRQQMTELQQSDRLSFNFREQRWSDVLDWFARQSDLSLVMDVAPPGTFTYSDTRDYSPTEAIDLLNSVLLTKGFTLVRRDRMLLVVQLGEKMPSELVPRVTLEELPQRGRFEFVSVMFPLGERAVEQVNQEIQALIGTHGQAVPLPQTKQLLVIETAGKMQAISVLIASIPEPKKPEPKPEPPPKPSPVFQSHSVVGLSAQATVETLQKLFADTQFTADEQAQQVHANAIPDAQKGIAAAIAQMQLNAQAKPPTYLEAYSVRVDDLGRLAEQIGQLDPTLKVSTDDRASRLIVVGSDAQHEMVRKNLEQVGAGRFAGTEVVLYDVRGDRVDEVRQLLASLLPRAQIIEYDGQLAVRGRPQDHESVRQTLEKLQGTADQPAQAALQVHTVRSKLTPELIESLEKLVPASEVTLAADGYSVIAVGPPADQDLLQKTLASLEDPANSPLRRQLHMVSVTRDNRQRLDRLIAGAGEDLANIKMVYDEPSQQLAIWATAAQHQMIEQLLTQVNDTSTVDTAPWQRIEMTSRAVDQLLSLMQEEFPGKRISLSNDRQALIVRATVDELTELQKKAEELEKLLTNGGEQSVEFYALKGLTAEELSRWIEPVRGNARVQPDTERQRLMVWATPREHEQIRALLEKLRDQPPAEPQVVMGYSLKHTTAAAVGPLLTKLEPKLTFQVDERSNRILVTAGIAEHSRVEAIIEQLDQEADQGQESIVEIYTLKSTTPQTALDLVRPMFPTMTWTADSAGSRLIANGLPRDQQKLRQIIERIDNAQGNENSVNSYDTGASDPEDVRRVLVQLAPKAVISADDEGRKIFVWGSAEEHARIQEAMTQFLKRSDTSRSQLKTYPLPASLGRSAMFLGRALIPNGYVSWDENNGHLVSWATPDKQAELAEALTALQQGAAQQSGATVEIYSGASEVIQQLTSALETVVPRAKVMEGTNPQQLAVWALPTDHEIIRKLWEQFQTKATDQPSSQVKVYPLDRERIVAEEARDTLDPELLEHAAVQVHEESNSLIVRAEENWQQQIAAAIEALNAELPTGGQRVTKVYQLTSASPWAVRNVLEDIVPDARFGADSNNGTLAITATVEDQKRVAEVVQQMNAAGQEGGMETQVYRLKQADINVTAEAIDNLLPRGNAIGDEELGAVIVTANKEWQGRVQMLVTQLDQVEPSAERLTKGYALKTIDADDVRRAVSALVPRATLTSDSESRTLLVTGSEAEQKLVAQVVADLDALPGTERTLEVYPPQGESAPEAIFSALERAFRFERNVRVSYQEETGTIFAFANPEGHEMIRKLIHQSAANLTQAPPRSPKVFPLKNVDGETAAEAIEALYESRRPAVDVKFDPSSNALVVIGTPEQHAQIADTVHELDGDARALEVFQLTTVDPFAFEGTIRQLFATVPAAVAPQVTSDVITQQLYVRGTPEQLEQVKQLLQQMGETVPGSAQATGKIRTIPFDGNVDRALEEIQRVWPQLRTNRIDVVTPARRQRRAEGAQPVEPTREPPTVPPRSNPSESSSARLSVTRYVATPQSAAQLGQPPVAEIEPSKEPSRIPAEQPSGALVPPATPTPSATSSPTTTPFSTTQPQRSVAAEQSGGAGLPNLTSSPAPTADGDPASITILPGERGLTIISEDQEALNQLESLIRTLSRPSGALGGSAGFGVYFLTKTGATEIERLLNDLFKQLPTIGNVRIGSVAFVADPRLNALVVYGAPKDRQLIEELLEVLDSPEYADSLLLERPELLPVQVLDAAEVVDILERVYRAQLSSGGRGRPTPIPEGIPSEIASVLQQLNAQNSGPLLTLGVDPTTNSIILRAPEALRAEITDFVRQLERQAQQTPARRIEVVPLQQGNAQRVERALRRLLAD